jgi:hypothetical protein
MREMKTKSRGKWTHGLSLGLCLIWLCFAEVQGANAQSTAAADQSGGNFRLMTAAEGRAIVATALEQGQMPGGAQDCSHLVHQIYLAAGYEYPYASSFDIYAGNEDFGRVKRPQFGDLITWPGHVGIIVDPVQHSFYSLVSTGLEAQDYEGPYWQSRGKPRFYRYKVQNPEIMTAAKAPAARRDTRASGQYSGASANDELSPSEGPSSNRPPKTVSERRAAVHGPPAPVAASVPTTMAENPQSIIVASGKKQPTRDEVAEGISELSNAAGNILRTDDPMKLQLPMVIFDRLDVERMEIKRDHGWARLQIDSRAILAGGGTEYKRRRKKVRWELRRTESGWEAVQPTDRTYVPQDVAVRNLAAQLARLTESDGLSTHQEKVLRQESQLASLLSALLENK